MKQTQSDAAVAVDVDGKRRGNLTAAPGTPVPMLRLKGRREEAWSLLKERLVVGSIQSADIRIQGEGISPIHAVLEVESLAGGFAIRIYDLASDTGTFLNGKKVVTHELKEGDSLIIGRSELLVSFESPLPAAEVPLEGRALFLGGDSSVSRSVHRPEDGESSLFDYRPMVRSSTAVVVFWYGTILETLHVQGSDRFSMGPTPAATTSLPDLLGTGDYVLFERTEEKTFLRLDARMNGVIKHGKDFSSIQEIVESLRKRNQGLGVELSRGDFAKIVLGNGIQIFLHHTYAPPRLRRRDLQDRDPFFVKAMLASLALTAATMGALTAIPVSQQIEAEQLPERVATLLYSAEKPRPVVTSAPRAQATATPVAPKTPEPQKTSKIDFTQPRPVPTSTAVAQLKDPAGGGKKQQGQAESREGRGARARGQEGTRGKPTARETGTPQTAATRPSPEGGTGRGSGNSQVADQGNVDLLSGVGAKFLNVLGNSSAKLGTGGEKVAGFGSFSTAGKGGQALTGTGKGGGGTAETLAGGLSDRGTGGGAVGTGKGAVGSGSGIIGGTTRVAIRSGGPEEAIVLGAIDADAVERALLAHKDEFRLCYEREINAENPKLAGRIGTTFVIGAAGRVNQAAVESTSLKSPPIERCVLGVIKRIQFPIPRGGGVVQVTYPFKFNPLQGG
jgi:pSer/pThr/pTyr-binding forkhead associated (FHA) protein